MSRRAAAVFAGAILLVLAAPLAGLAAEPCAALDVTCGLDEPIDPPPAPGAVDDVLDPVDDVLDDGGDPVDPVLGDVGRVVGDLLGGGGIIEPPGGGVVDPPGRGVLDPPGARGDDHPTEPGGGPRNGRAEPRTLPAPTGAGSTAAREGSGFGTDIIAAASGTRGTPGGSQLSPEGIVQAAVTGALLLLALFVVTVGFVLLQDRIDRGDPKLSIAPVRADLVAFE
ncbi:MAG TPA: hypothetical protein VFZ75_12140 [Actinomycetota bacterium]|nr:hypothetical protein [Actinomycetota bacterium]